MTISSVFIKEQQEGNAKVDVLFIMMEKVQEGFCEELMKLANQYGVWEPPDYSIETAGVL